jgi:hypothetical protein
MHKEIKMDFFAVDGFCCTIDFQELLSFSLANTSEKFSHCPFDIVVCKFKFYLDLGSCVYNQFTY